MITKTLKWITLLGMICILALYGCRDAAQIVVKNGLFIENVQIISSNDKKEVVPFEGFVVTDGSEIEYVGVRRPDVSGNFKTIDGAGKFLIPGLIDSHVHLANLAGMNFQQARRNPELVATYINQLPESFLYFGYTTLIDLNNYSPDLLNEIRKSDVRPDIFHCGKQLMVMDDFSMEMEDIPQADRYTTPFLNDKFNTKVTLPDSIDLEAHTAEVLTAKIAQDYEGICVKTLYEDASSGLPEFWEKPTEEIIKELVGVAHDNDLTVVMHAPSFEGQKFAMAAGVDVIAHAMWNWTSDPELFLDTVLTKNHITLLESIAEKQIGYQPTFRTIIGELDIVNGDLLDDPLMQSVLPMDYLEWIKMESANQQLDKIIGRHKFLKRVNSDFYFPIRNKFDSNIEMTNGLYKSMVIKINKVMKILADKNANLLFGSDGVAMNMYTNPPGYNGFLEMKHWDDAGVSLEKIFLAATINNAKAFGLENEIGTIEEGKRSNLVLMNSNPLEFIGAYNEIENVIVGGKTIERNELRADSK